MQPQGGAHDRALVCTPCQHPAAPCRFPSIHHSVMRAGTDTALLLPRCPRPAAQGLLTYCRGRALPRFKGLLWTAVALYTFGLYSEVCLRPACRGAMLHSLPHPHE